MNSAMARQIFVGPERAGHRGWAAPKFYIEVIVLQLGKLNLASVVGKLILAMLAAVPEMEPDLW
jgi:hypothetical protein